MSENKKKKHHKHHAVRPYFTTPILYVLIAMVVAVPLALALLNFSISTVHKIQPSFGKTAYDFRLDDSTYAPNDTTVGTVTIPPLYHGYKIGELRIDSVGVKTNVYYGNNIVSHKYGAGLHSDEQLPGENGTVKVNADVAGDFRALKNVKVGDEIVLTTSWGRYVYTVSEVAVSADEPEATFPQELLLYTENDNKVFSALGEEKLYVLADCKSGPQATREEVPHEQ